MAQKPARSEDGPEGPRKLSNMVQEKCTKEQPGWKVSPEGTRDSWEGLQQAWETQWQGFLKTLQAPHSRGENAHILETPWDDAKAFLASFEQVAEACRWPREEWVARLLPALSEEAQQAFNILKAHDKEDYGKVKAAILREFAIKMETQRLHFRQFRLQEVEDPRRIYRQLQELCCQWLKPERHTKEQILELLILEQFLTVLPPELQNWVREGGPENFSQAAALVEDFLMSQHHVGTWKWQEPLQRMIIADTEETVGGKQIYAEVKHSSDGDAALLGTGSKCPSHSNASIPLEGPEIAKANLTQELMNLKETGASLHMVEQIRTQPGQQTMFWQVMQEDGVAVQSLEGLLVPKPDLPSHLEMEDEISVPFPGENELLPGHDAGNKNRHEIKVESEMGGTGMLGEESQWELPAAAAIIRQKSDEKRSWVKMENNKMRPEEIYGTLNEVSQWNFPVLSEIPERRCVSNRQQEKKLVNGLDEYSKISESLTASFCEASTAHLQPKNPADPMHGLKFNYRLLETKHTVEGHYQCPMPGENIQQKSYFGFHQRTRTAKKLYKCAKCGKNFYSRPKLLRHQAIHAKESPYDCFECGKSFTCRRALMVHQIIHTGEKPFTCPQCGKCFNQNSNLLRHKKIHTGEKMHGCTKCGKNFYRKDKLIQHQRTHTGEKPYECPSCGKGFTMKEKLQRHQRTHQA